MSVPTYTPSSGDHVTVTRTDRQGSTATWTGVITSWSDRHGFGLTGHHSDGTPVSSHFATTASLLADYGVTQTIRPADQAPA